MEPATRRDKQPPGYPPEPSHSKLMELVGVPQGRKEPIPVASDAAGLELIARTDEISHRLVRDRGAPAIAAADGVARRTTTYAAILQNSGFYDAKLLADTRAEHEQRADPVRATAREAVLSAFFDFSHALNIFFRIFYGRHTQPLVDAARAATVKHDPAAKAMRAGVNAALGRLDEAKSHIPTRPNLRDPASRGTGDDRRTG